MLREPAATSFALRASASANNLAAAASRSARRASNFSLFCLVAGNALPLGTKKLRPKPDLTLTSSPRLPSF